MKLDKNTMLPLGFALVICGGAISIAYFAGSTFERLSKFDPVMLERRLSNIENEMAALNRRFDRIDRQRATLLPQQDIADKPAQSEPTCKCAYQQPNDIRHWAPPGD